MTLSLDKTPARGGMIFDMVERGIRQGADQKFAWYAAFGLTVTLIWLYLEILRLLSYLRDQRHGRRAVKAAWAVRNPSVAPSLYWSDPTGNPWGNGRSGHAEGGPEFS